MLKKYLQNSNKIYLKTFTLAFLSFIYLQSYSQTKEFDDLRASIFYKINKFVIYGNNTSKTDYNIALLGCTDQFFKSMQSQKPSKFRTGENYNISKISSAEAITGYDVIIVDESKNNIVDQVFAKAQNISQNGTPILIITNNYSEKLKVMINFEYSKNSLEPKVEYSLPNCAKYNISIDQFNLKNEFKNIEDIDIAEQLRKIEQNLKIKQQELDQKNKEIRDAEQRIIEQKKIVENQQKTIDEKQKEIELQQTHLKEISNQMLQTKMLLEQQQLNVVAKERELQEKQQALVEFQHKMEQIQKEFNRQKGIIELQKKEVEEFTRQVEEKKKELGNLTNIVRLQRYALTIFAFLLAIIIVLAFWIFRNYRKMKEQNNILEQQKNEIATQAEELEKANIELEKLSIVASQTRNAVSILSADGNFDWINSGFTKLYGYTLQLLKVELDCNIYNNPIYSGIEQKLKQALETKESFIFEHQAITRSGQKLWIQSSITPIKTYDNKIKQIVIVDSDISEIKAAEQKIAQQNKDIKKSITYASRIQTATLPSQELINQYLPDSFVLFLPRDIVSGDFYWIYRRENKTFFAAADCTGHGVPGAFMSMLGTTLLNEILASLPSYDLHPNIVLNNLREKIISSLSQTQGDSRDGIAISMCMLTDGSETMEFAASENPMIIVRNGEVNTYPADEMTIGVGVKEKVSFNNYTVSIQKNDMIYLFSDGYVDQFGGPKHKKFMIARLRDLFKEIYALDTQIQRQILHDTHIEWKGDREQIDDIIVFGVKI